MAIRANGLILVDVLLILWLVFVGLFGATTELGVEDTVPFGLVAGNNGDAIAPSDPGLVGSEATPLQACNGGPQRPAGRF